MIGHITAFALLLPLIPQAFALRSLAMHLSGSTEVVGVDSFSVLVNITNTGDETLKLYKNPTSVLSGFPEDTFKFSIPDGHSIQPPRFIGKSAKYSFKTATQFVTLSPGDSFVVAHKLAVAYEFKSSGVYNVEASREFYFYNFDTQQPETIYADSYDTYNFNLSESVFSPLVFQRSGYADNNPRWDITDPFPNCTPERQQTILNALPIAKRYVSGAINYLKGASPNGERFTNWFGTYSESAKNQVLDHFQRIQDSNIDTYTYICDDCITKDKNDPVCGCMIDTDANVNEDDFGKVYLCKKFWTIDSEGTDSRAGTIVHEATHFTRNGGTDDYKYGHKDTIELARTNQGKALMNADNHEYFAENTPALS